MTDKNTFPQPILITGGAGFLGSHMVAFCLEQQVDVVVIDNLSNSDLSNLQTLEKHFNVIIPFFNIDIRDQDKLKEFFNEHQFSAVIHFAGLKSVAESVASPDLYHANNVVGSQNVIDCIKEQGIKNVIFSSSATVYGDPQYLPIDEDHPVQPFNPYGETKAQIEQLFLQDEYFKNIGLDKSQSIKLINAERVGYYGGMQIPDLLNATQPELQNSQLIIFNGREDEVSKMLETGYQLEKSFTKNQQGVYILKRSSND